MQRANKNRKFKNNELKWDLVAEYLLNKVNTGEIMASELTTGPLIQTMQELGLPPECLKRIEGTITETARGARGHLDHERQNLPVYIHLFCQRVPPDCVPYSGNQGMRGWGYYLIERGGDLPGTLCDKYHRVVELYLYKEGD